MFISHFDLDIAWSVLKVMKDSARAGEAWGVVGVYQSSRVSIKMIIMLIALVWFLRSRRIESLWCCPGAFVSTTTVPVIVILTTSDTDCDDPAGVIYSVFLQIVYR